MSVPAQPHLRTSAPLSTCVPSARPSWVQTGSVPTLKSGAPGLLQTNTAQEQPGRGRTGTEGKGGCDLGRRHPSRSGGHLALTLPVDRAHSPLESGCPGNTGTNRIRQKGCSGLQSGPVPAKPCQVAPEDSTRAEELPRPPVSGCSPTMPWGIIRWLFKPLGLGMICHSGVYTVADNRNRCPPHQKPGELRGLITVATLISKNSIFDIRCQDIRYFDITVTKCRLTRGLEKCQAGQAHTRGPSRSWNRTLFTQEPERPRSHRPTVQAQPMCPRACG